jgi:2-polyprenyl-3-methyl-5-hydroxy-6-metoxy-1,4-benzoquinol methylase
MDEQRAGAIAEKVLADVNGGMTVLSTYLGHRLGLFKELSRAGNVTPGQFAERTGMSERYLREWLECMAVSDQVDFNEASGTFSLSPEQTAVFVTETHPLHMSPFTQWIPSFSLILGDLAEAFRTGGGVEYEKYGQDTLDAIGRGNRPMFANDYASKWVPAFGLAKDLANGGRVLEVGCGVGWSSIHLAKSFPGARIVGVDIDAESVRQARDNAEREGVADRVSFHHSPIEDWEGSGEFDLVTAIECLHDMPYPIAALKKMRRLAGDAGKVIVADEAANDSLAENRNFLGQLFYNFSLLHCLPQAMVFPDAAGTGTVMRPSALAQYARDAGFSGVEVLPIENDFWRFYRLSR